MEKYTQKFVIVHKNGGFDLAFDEMELKFFLKILDIYIFIW